jgi:hypothetical protein
MSRAFSIPTVLRMVPNCLLKEFFERLGHGDLGIVWEGLSEREIEPIIQAMNALPPAQLDNVEGALHNVFDLACETGIGAIIEAGALAGDLELPSAMPQEGGPYHKAMWAWLNRPEVVNQAILIHQVEHLAWWRKRNDLPHVEPDRRPATLKQLEKALSHLLLCEQGRGKLCTVETLTRRGTDYVFAHPDDFVQNVTAHDGEGKLAARTFRQTFPIVFAYNRCEGTLELFAKVPTKLKPRLEELFAQVILGVELEDWAPDAAYDLNPLKHRSFSLATDPADRVRPRVRRMRLSFRNSHRRLTLEAAPDSGVEDVYDMLDEVLNRERVPLSAVNVTMVTFCFEFLPLDGRKPGTLTFDVAYPSSCSLRNQRPERIELAQKYLKQWGIDVARTVPADVAAAG